VVIPSLIPTTPTTTLNTIYFPPFPPLSLSSPPSLLLPKTSDGINDHYMGVLRQQEAQVGKKTYRWRYFYGCSIILVLALLACALGIYLYQTKFDSE